MKGNVSGIYKVKYKAPNINKNISNFKVNGKKLIWQFLLDLQSNIIIAKKDLDKDQKTLTFYKDWKKERWGSKKQQIFKAKKRDIEALKNILKRSLSKV